jgi:hypothetical protein
MKKLSLYVFLLLMCCNVGFAACLAGNCKNGQGTFKWENNDSSNGDTYVGEWKNSKRHGKGTYTWNQFPKQDYVGEWKKNKMHGRGIYTWHKTRQIFIGEWRDGVRVTGGTASERSVQLKQLVKMHEDGIISQAEFDQALLREKNKKK